MTAKEKLIVEKIRAKTLDALEVVGAAVEGWARDNVKVITGNLRGSITHATTRKQSRVKEPASQEDAVPKPSDKFTVRVGSGVAYAARIEFGFQGTDSLGRSYNQAAQAYLRPAVKDNETRITQLFKEKLKF